MFGLPAQYLFIHRSISIHRYIVLNLCTTSFFYCPWENIKTQSLQISIFGVVISNPDDASRSDLPPSWDIIYLESPWVQSITTSI